jgi:hypothetical protein
MFELLGQETRPNLHVVKSPKEIWVILGIDEPDFEHVDDANGKESTTPNA